MCSQEPLSPGEDHEAADADAEEDEDAEAAEQSDGQPAQEGTFVLLELRLDTSPFTNLQWFCVLTLKHLFWCIQTVLMCGPALSSNTNVMKQPGFRVVA